MSLLFHHPKIENLCIIIVLFFAQDLQVLITKLLERASECGMSSIALPAIGTGNLGFPRDVTARAMYEAVIQFSKDNPDSSVKCIRFWVYDKDQPTIKVN